MSDHAPLWTSEEIAAAVGSTVTGAPFVVGGLDIDTRVLKPGDLFIALTGERDGRDFLPAAAVAGASGALISASPAPFTAKPTEGASRTAPSTAFDGPPSPLRRGGETLPLVSVEDTLAALERLGVAARERAPAKRIAVTGSVGKTSVSQAISAALKLAGHSHAPVKSFNNHIGVPLTLARMPRGTEFAVFEIGMNHAGEIGPLSKLVGPDVCVITTVGPVHTENFPDGEAGVARAKAEIFEGLKPGGVAVLNANDRWFNTLADAAQAHGAKVLSFGRAEICDAQLTAFSPSPQGVGARVTARIHGREITFPIAQTGAHWGLNSLATLLALEAIGVSLHIGLQALADFAPLQGRGAEQTLKTAGGGYTLIDESYNANPVSMAAAIATLGARPTQGRRIAVLTDMLELGEDAARYHVELATPIDAASVDLVFCAGPMMSALWDALPPDRRGGYAADAQTLAPSIVSAVKPGDIVMVKGSNGSNAAAVIQALHSAVPVSLEPLSADSNARER